MQTCRDQQTVDETEDTGAQRARADNPFTARMNSVLNRRPDVTENRRQHQTEEARGDRHKTFAAKEAQEIRKFDTGPTVINGAAHQTGNDTRQDAHVDFRVNRHHRFGQDEVPDRTRQRCCTRAVLRPAGCHTDGEDQCEVIEDRPARLRDKGDIQ